MRVRTLSVTNMKNTDVSRGNRFSKYVCRQRVGNHVGKLRAIWKEESSVSDKEQLPHAYADGGGCGGIFTAYVGAGR